MQSLLDVPQSGDTWLAHWVSSKNLADSWLVIKRLLIESGLTLLAEDKRDVSLFGIPPIFSISGQRHRNREEERLSLNPSLSSRDMVSVLHWYTEITSQSIIKSHMIGLMEKLGLEIIGQPLDYEFGNQGVPNGYTLSFLIADGRYDGQARHVVLAESHLAVGPHFSVHTYPQDSGGLAFFTFVGWDQARFFRLQRMLSKIHRGFLSAGIVFAGQFSLSSNENFYTLVCCSETKFNRFMILLTRAMANEAKVVFPGCAAPLKNNSEIQYVVKPESGRLPLPEGLVGKIQAPLWN